MNIKQYAKKIYGMNQEQLFGECLDAFEKFENKKTEIIPVDKKESYTLEYDANEEGYLKETVYHYHITKELLTHIPYLVTVLTSSIKEVGLFTMTAVCQESDKELSYYNIKVWIVPKYKNDN
jgi:hypothetical protein